MTFAIETDATVDLAERIGLSKEELRSTRPTLTNYAYTRFLISVAYTSSEYKAVLALIREMLDSIAEKSSDDDKREMERLFIIGSRCEYMFWDAAYRKEGWPI